MDDPPPRIDRLHWDDWNREHIAKHDVTPEEVLDMLLAPYLVRDTYKQRYQLIGPTSSGRILSVVVGESPADHGTWYVFSARTASRVERRIHASFQKEGDE